MAGDVRERRRGDVRGGGKGTKVDAGGTITDGKGTTVSTTERAGPPAPRPETRGEFRVARGRETGNEKTNEEREKKNKRRRDRRDERARSTREGTDVYRSEPFADRGGRKQDEREQKGTETRRGRKTKRDEETKGERERAEGKTKRGKTRHEGNKRTRAQGKNKGNGNLQGEGERKQKAQKGKIMTSRGKQRRNARSNHLPAYSTGLSGR